MQNCGSPPPPLVTWAEGLSTETVGEDLFLDKNWTKFEWRPFFFWSSPNFGQENGLGFGLENFHSGLHYSQIFWISWPPPFENPAYATVWDVDQMLYFNLEKHKKC